MKKRTAGIVAALLIVFSLLPLTAFCVTTESLETTVVYPPKAYFYSQLSDEAKSIYDVLAAAENLPALQSGTPIAVVAYTATIPSDVKQAQYNTICDVLNQKKAEIQELMTHTTDATAAFYRDRSEIFWTTGVSSRLVHLKDGELVQGAVALDPGHTYTVQFEIMLPLAEDWDGDSPTDRSVTEDIAILRTNIGLIADVAATRASRQAQIAYINEQLCRYNRYNTPAVEGDREERNPWSPISALDQLTAPNDQFPGALLPVCEGYARAFKLICDEMDIPCILVSGLGEGGDHMWNYVQMEDGYWYAIDVTWNDSTGQNTYLLVGKDVMDQAHTTDSRFMQNPHMTFSYPVLNNLSYVAPADGLEVAIPTLTYLRLSEGYTQGEAESILIKNLGEGAEQITAVSVDSAVFVISGPETVTLAGGETDGESYTIRLAGGLLAGSYGATVTVTYGVDRIALAHVYVDVMAVEAPSKDNGPEETVPPAHEEAPEEKEEAPPETEKHFLNAILDKKIWIAVSGVLLALLIIGAIVAKKKGH